MIARLPSPITPAICNTSRSVILRKTIAFLLFLIGYERGRRLKIWGRATVIDDGPALFKRVRDPDYPGKAERVIRIMVEAWDLNCRQHFPKLVRAQGAQAQPHSP